MTSPDSRPHLPATSRRSVLKATAWTTPAVLAVGAAPAFANSSVRVNLYSLAANANEPIDGTTGGSNPYYSGARTLTYTVTYGNLGPDQMPAGAIVSLGLPHPQIWDESTIRVTNDPAGKRPVFLQQRTQAISAATPEVPAFNRSWFDFTLGEPIASGGSFTLTFSILLKAGGNTSSQHWAVRDFADIGVGATGVQDTQLANNQSRVEETRMYNPSV